MTIARNRVLTYWLLGAGLAAAYQGLGNSTWQSSAQLHTLMESLATLLAFMVGSMALVHYYTKENNTILIIGTGFLGTGFLDGYHAFVTSPWFMTYLPSDLPTLTSWSWLASRLFLSIVLFYSWYVWHRQGSSVNGTQLEPRRVYSATAMFTLLSFLIFALIPLPKAYQAGIAIHRPFEFLPAFFFGLAIVGYVKKGLWRSNSLEHWLVLALIVNLMAQGLFMPFSAHLFDMAFDSAHLLKIFSYVCVLIGLFVNMYETFRKVDVEIGHRKTAQKALANSETRFRAVIETAVEGIITIDCQGIVETMNPAATNIFGYDAAEVIGQNINMLMPEPYHSEHDAYIRRYLSTGEPKIIGTGREVEGRHKDGTVFPIELAVSEMEIGGKRMFTGLVRDITERKETERLKNEFISTVSHELRTPLTSIQGSLGLILGGAAGDLPEKIKDLLEIANNNSTRLVRLINDILDIEKIESGKIVFDFKTLEIMPLIRQAVQNNEAYAHEFGLDIVITSELPGYFVFADSDRLMQVITNLLSNAAKFSDPDNHIEVAITDCGGCIRTTVTNYGPGIPVEFRSNIFDKFSQADSSSRRQKGGTGLGLNICKVIVEKLGGQIDFESEIDGKTSFFFELPAWRQADSVTATEILGHVTDKILVCEDDPDVANLLRLMLEKNGHSVDVVFSAEQAKKRLAEGSYHAMTLDLMLPGQSGIDFFKELRQNEKTRNFPVIVVSAIVASGKREIDGQAISVIDWLEKPIDEKRLERAVSQAIQRKAEYSARILHVEDDPDIVRVVRALLQDVADVDVASDLAKAKEKLARPYDLVILDIALPDGNGEALLTTLGARNPPIPVVIFSAKEIDPSASQNVAANLVKSKTSNELLIDTIESMLRNTIEQRGK